MCFWYQGPELPEPSRDVLEPLAIPNKRELRYWTIFHALDIKNKSSINRQLHGEIYIFRIINNFFHWIGGKERGEGRHLFMLCFTMRVKFLTKLLKNWKYRVPVPGRDDLVSQCRVQSWNYRCFFLPFETFVPIWKKLECNPEICSSFTCIL